jgi:hypothetical protein
MGERWWTMTAENTAADSDDPGRNSDAKPVAVPI